MINTATKFGQSLDNDEFEKTKEVLASDCVYSIGEQVIIGPAAICNSYESNMIEGRKKLDGLEWGESRIEPIGDNEFFVHFTDFLTHRGKKYTHRCKQRLEINKLGLISKIEHIHDQEEQEKLDAYYKSVGLK